MRPATPSPSAERSQVIDMESPATSCPWVYDILDTWPTLRLRSAFLRTRYPGMPRLDESTVFDDGCHGPPSSSLSTWRIFAGPNHALG